MSLSALSRLVSYSPGYLSRVEQGQRPPTTALARSCDAALAAGGVLAGLVPERPRVRGRYPPRPAQLPPAIPGFSGRAGALAELEAALSDGRAAVIITAIGGMAGVGKTALAVYFAHQMAARFPDGQLYVNLRGFGPSGLPVAPGAAVRGFLDALQVPTARIPADLDAQAGLYRSLLAGKRMLVVADNARDAGQARPLLPGTPGCLVLVTSRSQLTSLVAADGAHLIDLDVFTAAEARELLTARLGPGRVAAEPQAATEIIDRCGRLPLALAIVAARATAHPAFPLSDLAAELRGDHLDGFAGEVDSAADLRAVFSWSYRALTPEAARLFRLLSLHAGPDTSAAAAASLAAQPLPDVRQLLAELADAHLIGEHRPGRYALHDLLRAYAHGLALAEDPPDQRHAAAGRVLEHYLHTARFADMQLNPTRDPITLTPPRPGVSPEKLDGHQQMLAWFTAEHAVLLAAVVQAAEIGLDACTWQLAWVLWPFLDRRGHWHDQAAVQLTALIAARRLGDPNAQAHAHRFLAEADSRLRRFDDADAHLLAALDLYRQAGDQAGQAHSLLSLALAFERRDRCAEALDPARQAIDLYRAAGNRRGQALALNAAGWFLCRLGGHQQAFALCQQAMDLLEELGDQHGLAGTWDSIGYIRHHLGHYAEARNCYQQALALFQAIGDLSGEAGTLTRLGDTCKAVGDPGAARAAWRQALAILDDLDDPDAERVRATLAALHRPAGHDPV
jgi:tetratricopeptide (TPR) repeat protein